MIYIFEDNYESDISKLFRIAYNEDITNKFIYANGNCNIINIIKQKIETEDFIVVYLDMIPGNRSCYDVYKAIRKMSFKNEYRIFVLPIVCSEYYFIKSISNEEHLLNREKALNCVNKIPHLEVLKESSDDVKRYCKNFEKYCKWLIKYGSLKECIKPYNKIEDKYGQYYVKDCKCNDKESECIDKELLDKSIELLRAFNYIPKGSSIDSTNYISEDIWDIHRELVEQFNNFADKYAKYTGDNKGYRHIKPIK